jgi:RND superfamily putative drug exporter
VPFVRRFTVLAALVVVAWLGFGAWAGPLSGKLSEVSKNDNAAFLPSDAEATRAQQLAAEFSDRATVPAVVVYERASGITPADTARVAADARAIAEIEGVVAPLPPPVPSDDGQAIEIIVPIDSTATGGESGEVDAVVERLREVAASRDGLSAHVTGPAGLLADLIAVFRTIDGPLLLVTAAVVVVILLVVYRSPVLWLIPIISAGIAYSGAGAAVYYLAREGVIDLNGQAQGILTVLVFGAGTDYALLLIARYREELHRHERPARAMAVALRGAAPAIIASAGTVIASLLCLLLSGLNSNRALGPVSAVGIGVTLVVMLTLLPALLVLGGRWAFWPLIPRSGTPVPEGRVWGRVAGLIGRRARVTWIATTVALLALGLGLTRLDTSGLSQTDAFTSRPDSVVGQEVLSRHYSAGIGSPALVFARADAAGEVVAAARAVPGVTDVRLVPASPAAAGDPTTPVDPKIVNDRVQIQATLSDPADSSAAEDTVSRLREAVHPVSGADALVGGFSAVNLDTRIASDRDRNVIIPVVLCVIAVILALLLRTLLAPVLLIATVVLSFAATLGLCALLFTYVFGFTGTDPSFPLFAFVFLVALGIDYNIFLMSRVREEAVRHGTRQGVLRGLIVTGGVITSAGVVLAATFSALAVLPLVVLVELGVAVAVGVLLDTVVVRSLLVPALAHDIGRRIWWPSRLSRRDANRPEQPERAPAGSTA